MKRLSEIFDREMLVTLLIICLIVWAMPAHAQADTKAEPKAERAVIVPQNNYQAHVAGATAIANARADQCDAKVNGLKGMAAKCTTDICLAYFADKVTYACGGGPGGGEGQQIAVAAPPVEKTLLQEIKETGKDVLATAFPFLDRVFARQERRDAVQSQERQAVALYNAFTTQHGRTVDGMLGLGTAGINGVRDTAHDGFGALERGMTAAFTAPREPTNVFNVNVTGDDNSLFGSVNNRRTRCTGTGGNGGNPTTGAAGIEGSPSGNTGATTGGAAPCTFTK